MRNLIRSPLTWIVGAEVVVVGALVVLAWSAVAGTARPLILAPSITLPDATSGDPYSLPDLQNLAGQPPLGPQPALNASSSFWRDRLTQLNRDQQVLERLEWRLVHGAMEAVKRYFETVVLPAIRRAEHPPKR